MSPVESQVVAHDAHDGPIVSRPDPQILERGHEADTYDALSVWSVPILVVVFFVLAFVTTTILFYFLAPAPERPEAHPLAVEQNRVPLEQRLARITRGGEVDQPRLEPLRIRTGDARAITRPEAPEGNSPEIHPEDLRPSPTTTPDLYRSGWLDANKTAARVTIDQAMHLVLQRNLLPVRKDPRLPLRSTQLPTTANAGRSVSMYPADERGLQAAPHAFTEQQSAVWSSDHHEDHQAPKLATLPEAPPPRTQR
jgi:hypothetical protein